MRVLVRSPSAVGVGVDSDADWLSRARANADARIPGRKVEFVHAAADDAGLCPGSFDAVVNVAASHAHGGYPAALAALAALVRPGGVVLLGEGFWACGPSPRSSRPSAARPRTSSGASTSWSATRVPQVSSRCSRRSPHLQTGRTTRRT